jgi:hypothetical protein
MRSKEINLKIQSTQIEMVLQIRKQEGAKALFEAACWANDGQEAAKLREQLHTILDAQLDCSAACMSLSRKLLEADRDDRN